MTSVRSKMVQTALCAILYTVLLTTVLGQEPTQAQMCIGIPCPLGKISALGLCQYCSFGFVKRPDDTTSADAVCVDAKSCGSSAFAWRGRCNPCPLGKVVSPVGKSRPILSDCKPCPTGTVKVPDDDVSMNAKCVDASTVCGSSGYAGSDGRCKACGYGLVIQPVGKKQPVAADCKPCSGGTVRSPDNNYSTDAKCVDASIACGNSSYGGRDGRCKACPVGQVIPAGTKTPQEGDCATCGRGLVKSPNNDFTLQASCVDGATCGSSGFAAAGSCQPCGIDNVIQPTGKTLPVASDCARCPDGTAKTPNNDVALDAVCK